MHTLIRTFALALMAQALAANVGAQALPEFNPTTGILTIPEVKTGTGSVYNAVLKFDGKQAFTLQSYDKTLPAPAPANIPPLGSVAEMEKWIASGAYKSWACEPAPHSQTLNSPHGRVRICSNPLLAASTGSTHPVGATSFKELYSGSTLYGYALGVKVKAGTAADTWHWYETLNGSNVVNGTAVGICENCHNGSAAKDRVFVRVP